MPKAEFQKPEANIIQYQKIDRQLFTQVAAHARQHPSLRLNHNFHQEQDPVQRFLNVLQPGTYVRPNRLRYWLRMLPGAAGRHRTGAVQQ